MHEILCRWFGGRFDNRMLQMKKQLRGNAVGFCTAFPLLYSKFIREEISGQSRHGRAQPPATDCPAK
jgi:hypothetical protein